MFKTIEANFFFCFRVSHKSSQFENLFLRKYNGNSECSGFNMPDLVDKIALSQVPLLEDFGEEFSDERSPDQLRWKFVDKFVELVLIAFCFADIPTSPCLTFSFARWPSWCISSSHRSSTASSHLSSSLFFSCLPTSGP